MMITKMMKCIFLSICHWKKKKNLKLLMVMTTMMTAIMKFLGIFVAVQILLKFVSFSARAAGVLLKFLPPCF